MARIGRFMLGAIIGSLFATAIVILLTPQPGSDLRKRLGSRLEDLQNDFERKPNRETSLLGARGAAVDPEDRVIFIKAVVNGKIIGSIRAFAIGDTAYPSRMMVHPYFRGRGIGRRLLDEMEKAFPKVSRFETKTGHHSKRNLFQLARRGYTEFKREPFTPTITWVYLQKSVSPSGHPAS